MTATSVLETDPPGRESQPDGGPSKPLMVVGRYALFDEIAHGGFATIHLGRTLGAGGFARTVAIKRLHRQYSKDPEVSAMFLDEARVVARIRHPNVLPTLDLIDDAEELFLVMEYVEGISLRHLQREAGDRHRRIPLPIVLRILCGVLRGLHAAHEARDEQGEALHVIHRDVSPENVLVGIDGHPRLLDFGVARALGQYHSTRDGEVKGKLQYMTPEQVRGEGQTRRSDIFSASVVLWEAMTGETLFGGRTIAKIAHDLLHRDIDPPSRIAGTPKKLDGIVMQGLEREPDDRWSTAEQMAQALEAVGELASEQSVARYVQRAGGEKLTTRAEQVARVESAPLPRAGFDSRTVIDLSETEIQDEETGDPEVDADELVEAERRRAADGGEAGGEPAPVTEPSAGRGRRWRVGKTPVLVAAGLSGTLLLGLAWAWSGAEAVRLRSSLGTRALSAGASAASQVPAGTTMDPGGPAAGAAHDASDEAGSDAGSSEDGAEEGASESPEDGSAERAATQSAPPKALPTRPEPPSPRPRRPPPTGSSSLYGRE